MEVFRKTLSAVFAGERRYVIPLFQRPYVWTRENQWEALWDDVVDRAELELGSPEADPPPHFMGAIVIQQRASWGDQLLSHDVIDGQQRLTTFQLLLAAFRDIATARDEKQVVASLVSWTRNTNPIADPDVEQFKLWPTGRDVEQYRFVVGAGSSSEIEKRHPATYKRKRLLPRPRLVEAYLFFSQKIEEWLLANGPTEASDRAKALRRVFDKRMQLVSIELEKAEDPQAIFETLNARGVPLLASDLLRNYIFQRAGGAKEADRLHAKYWSRFEVPDDPSVPDGARFWEIEERQGRLSRARLDLFVQHYLAMQRGTDALSGRLFPEYKSWIENDKPFGSLEEELREFTKYADLFRKVIQPDATTPLGRFAERLRALDTSTVYPLVLRVLGTDMPDSEREGIFVDLESFLIRRAVCQRTIKNYNRLFLQVMRDFTQGPPTRAALQVLLAAGTGEAVDWPDDAAFEKAWNSVDAYNELKAGKTEMILRALEAAMNTKVMTEAITIHGKLSVEHVLPQSWAAYWPLSGIDHDAESGARDDLVHDFGNLTLLTAPLNSTVSNGPADQKLPRIARDSALRLNTYFQNRTTWNEKDIAMRGGELFKIAKRVWPRP